MKWEHQKDYILKKLIYFPCVESFIYFHTKEFFMLHKPAENSDTSRRQKSWMLEIYKHVKILSILYDDEVYDLTNWFTLTVF